MMVAVALGCPADDDGSDGPANTSVAMGSTGADTDDHGATSHAEETSAATTSVDSGGEVDACLDGGPDVGAPCKAGDGCTYGDDCGSWTYSCVDGVWAQTDGSGCGLPPVACGEAAEGDGCDSLGEVCDEDEDCVDVLECEGFEWVAHAMCTG